MAGRTATEMLGTHRQEVVHHDDRPKDNDLFDRAVATGQGFTNEKRFAAARRHDCSAGCGTTSPR